MEKRNYESNSKLNKEQKEGSAKKIEKVVSGTVKQSKKGFFSSFFEKDLQSVGRYILSDVLIPEFKKAIADILKRTTDGATDMLFYGETTNRSSEKRGTGSRISYDRKYDLRNRTESYPETHRPSNSDLIFDNRKDAEEILDHMRDIIDQYGIASMSDLHELAGIKDVYTENKYGWTDLSGARIDRVRDGYALKLPRAMPIS